MISLWQEYPLIKAELRALEDFLESSFSSKRNRLDAISRGVLFAGGKRIRPAFTILCAMCGKYDRERILPLAACVETLHTATLVHDDIIDDADLRRGAPTVVREQGADIAVFTGDYLLAKALVFFLKGGLEDIDLGQIAAAIEAMCKGEADQFFDRGHIPDFRRYLGRIMKKTALLFAASCTLGAHAAGCDQSVVREARRFGLYYGCAFQIADDLLDVSSERHVEGKPVMHDIKEGVFTLPVLLATARNPETADIFRSVGKKSAVASEVLETLRATGAIDASLEIKERYRKKALSHLSRLPQGENTEILKAFAHRI